MSVYPYDAPVTYESPAGGASPQTSVHLFPRVHTMLGQPTSLPPQPHQYLFAGARTPGVYAITPPLVLRRQGIMQTVKSVPGNRSYELVSRQAPRIPTAGDPRLGSARTSTP